MHAMLVDSVTGRATKWQLHLVMMQWTTLFEVAAMLVLGGVGGRVLMGMRLLMSFLVVVDVLPVSKRAMQLFKYLGTAALYSE